jgi:molybdopterin molybdotransferase
VKASISSLFLSKSVPLITVQQATEIIHQVAFVPGVAKVNIGDAVGRVLAENINADRDLPPFHRATMDGIAIRFDDYEKGKREFVVEGIQAAGQPQVKARCVEIMTGAMLPEGTDTVVRYEDVTIKGQRETGDGKRATGDEQRETGDEQRATGEGQRATINVPVEKNQSVHAQGIDAKKGETLLTPGIVISPAEVALLASVGKSEVLVYDVKSIAIITTGDELVPVEETPLPWQIRRSNGAALASALKQMNIDSVISHLPDDPQVLETELKKIISKHDVVILSGGVSKGKFDYIPGILEKLGIKKAFHQVKQRPGKPFLFGRNDTKTVFALPGNPVSTFLCFHRYIKPWIEAGLGIAPKNTKAILAENYKFKPDLTYFLQVKVDTTNGTLLATPDAGEGSGDFANLRNVDGFIELPSDRTDFAKGEIFPYISFRR